MNTINLWKNRRAVVTGGSRGIGAAVVAGLVERGAHVVFGYREKRGRAEALCARLRSEQHEVLAVGGDLTRPSDRTTLITAAGAPIDILVLCAAGGMEEHADEWYAWDLNVTAQIALVAEAVPAMRPGSCVVYVTSHDAHYARSAIEQPDDYEPVARSKRVAEDALRAISVLLEANGVRLLIVSSDIAADSVLTRTLRRSAPERYAGRLAVAGSFWPSDRIAEALIDAVEQQCETDQTVLIGPSSFQNS